MEPSFRIKPDELKSLWQGQYGPSWRRQAAHAIAEGETFGVPEDKDVAAAARYRERKQHETKLNAEMVEGQEQDDSDGKADEMSH